jgi:hypothetical protein
MYKLYLHIMRSQSEVSESVLRTQLKALILLMLDSTIAVAEDTSHQIVMTGRRIGSKEACA